jgi:hypothetical protein
MESESLDLHYVPISGDLPLTLRKKTLAGDSVGSMMTEVGAKIMLAMFEEHQPDVFLYWCHYMEDGSKKRLDKIAHMMRLAKKVSPRTQFLYGNGNQQGFPDYNVKAFKDTIDGILVNTRDEREFRMYKDFGIKHVDTLHTFGFDPMEHGPSAYGTTEPEFDCFFGGSYTINALDENKTKKYYPLGDVHLGKRLRYPKILKRIDFLKGIAERFDLLVCGNGAWPMKHPGSPGTWRKYEDSGTGGYQKSLGLARINLGMYHWDLVRYYTKRTIYSGASGRLYVCHYIPEMEKDFTNHRNIVWFDDEEEAHELIRHYLDHDDEREKIAREQRKHFIRKHSWEARPCRSTLLFVLWNKH